MEEWVCPMCSGRMVEDMVTHDLVCLDCEERAEAEE